MAPSAQLTAGSVRVAIPTTMLVAMIGHLVSEPGALDLDVLVGHLRRQEGVISRRQVVDAGGDDHDIARMIRRREWSRVHEGVYVNHTGTLSWPQRAWSSVLFCWPASLNGAAALRAFGVRGHGRADDAPVQVAIAQHRRVETPPSIEVSRLKDYDSRVQGHLSPPRVRIEEALLQVASVAVDDAAAMAVLADAVQRGHTTVDRLRVRILELTRLRRRNLLLTVLEDVASGAFSVLEGRYLREVERPHGLPTAKRQRRVSLGRSPAYRDVEYTDFDTVVELDGRLGHDTSIDHWKDLDRDLESAVAGAVTLRAGWKQVLEPCRLAGAVGGVLAARGWDGPVEACGPSCSAPGDSGGSRAPTEGDPPLSA